MTTGIPTLFGVIALLVVFLLIDYGIAKVIYRWQEPPPPNRRWLRRRIWPWHRGGRRNGE